MLSLDQSAAFCKLLGDATRVRLLALLEEEELTVAELTQITQLAQSRVSTHLAKLREVALVRDRRAGVSSYYSFNENGLAAPLKTLWASLRASVEDSILSQDAERLTNALNARHSGESWADAVAGDMHRQYSPGRTFDASAKAVFGLLQLGNVLDIASGDGAMAEVLAPRAQHITCVDFSEKVVNAGRKRLAHCNNITFTQGDMHALNMPTASFDQVFLLHALTYTNQPQAVITEAARLLKPGGTLVIATLQQHNHADIVTPYNHVNHGFSVGALTQFVTTAGLQLNTCDIAHRERRTPNFEVISLLAHKP